MKEKYLNLLKRYTMYSLFSDACIVAYRLNLVKPFGADPSMRLRVNKNRPEIQGGFESLLS